MEKTIELVTVGRAGIDLNTTVLNAAFADVSSFRKSIGGSPANIAQGAARLGLRTGFLGKVSGDGMGEYILKEFERQGIDCSGVCVDHTGAKNCLAVTEIVSPGESGTYRAADGSMFHHGTYLYRENTADVLITPEEIGERLIAKAQYVLLSGTAFSAEPSRSAMFRVIEYARRYNTKLALDIDYRPFGWASLEEASACYQHACEEIDIIIGNREEFDVVEYATMRGNQDNARSARAFLDKGTELVIVKDGGNGSAAYLPGGEVIRCGVIPTEIVKTFGSGDAYAAGLMYGLLRKEDISYAMQLGSACASIVLTKIDCAPAMPDYETAEAHRQRHSREMMP